MSDDTHPSGTARRRLKAELHAALLGEVARHHQATPCLRPPQGIDWLDPHPGTQQAAAALCDGCPAFQACKRYSATTRTAPGVWAGTTEADRKRSTSRNPRRAVTQAGAA